KFIYSLVEIVDYLESMGFYAVVVDDMNDNVLPKCDIHYWPWDGLVLTAIESNVDAFICHDHCEVRCIRRACSSSPAVCRLLPEEMQRVSRCEQPRQRYDDGNGRQEIASRS